MKRKFLFSLLVVLSLFLVVGCGSKKDSETKPKSNNTDEVIDKIDQSNNNSNNDDSSALENINLYSDDKQIVFANQNVKMVFTYEGDTITGYYEYIDYQDKSLANQALAALKYADDKDEDDNTIKDYYVKGTYLVIEYKESEFEGTTLEDIKRTYSYLEEIQKNN